mmetsp:Transcript_26413/g.25293  ORF Transcript_26413/g.25293 Transcript_26413/m.25293 type:complete len:184 (+) Transcript_26413:286-837(+)|eukprot:CAMPEP_0119041778 /NCGR_PEP_ID=MMETSP1177-20130426/13567_1 /TAXON_ID=2985 /ORGANISM="Ochromonas sp, Strain CCMP1899" /LENGTH=183 /DNA_ID=CAMNT_0007008089 /DNA_START=266 /DNA_END=817 /DNA_ORIENTATION=-
MGLMILTAILFFSNIVISTAFSVDKFSVPDFIIKTTHSKQTSLFSLWDLNLQRIGKGSRNLEGNDSEVILGEGKPPLSGPQKHLKGAGVDERYSALDGAPYSENDPNTISRMYELNFKHELLLKLEGGQLSDFEKINCIKVFNLHGVIRDDYVSPTPTSALQHKSKTLSLNKLMEDWDFDIEM